MATVEQSRSKLVDQLDHVQTKAFTKWVNSHLEKSDIEIEDLFQDLRDGSILLLLLELFTGTKLPRERGKMIVHHKQNVKTALTFLTDQRKIRIFGIPVEAIVEGNKKLTLGLVWMLILNFELSVALPTVEGERATSPKEVSAKAIKKELLQWSQKATEGYDEVNIKNFHTSWKDGMAFCAIINRHRPDLLDYDECDPDKPLENLEKAFSIAEKELGVIRFLDPEDVNVNKPAEEAILIYVSALRQVFPVMPPPHRRKGPPISSEEYNSQYSALQDWITARRRVVASREFPSSANGVRKILQEFKKLRSVEDLEKEKEKDEVRAIAAEIRVFEMKKKTNFGVLPIKDLEQSWSDAMKESDQYETVLQDELDRLEKQEKIINEVESDCDSISSKLKSIERQLDLFENESKALSSDEITEEVSEIQTGLKGVKDILEGLENKIQLLKDGGYSDWNRFDERISAFWKTFSGLRSRLDGCVTSVGEAQVLLSEADMKLRVCELWLMEHGKFADNQFIIKQKEVYESFQTNQLAEADVVMTKLNSTPLPGLEDDVMDLNKRWEQIQFQLQNRVSNLTSIVDTVTSFDVVKLPLQKWCITQQECYSSLPLLETNKEELEKQKTEFETMLVEVLSHESTVHNLETLSEEFLHHREPVQSLADKYARKLRRLSRDFATTVVKEPLEDELKMSLFEQTEVLKGEWHRFKEHVEQRLQQSNDLLDRLNLFEKTHTSLMELVKEGEELLRSEQPVGNSAQRIEEQMATCQSYRQCLSENQSKVDTMLSLGRSIIGEYYTNPLKDTLSQTLTEFIQNWSNLLLAWQNWYDELHATGEQSRDLSYQFLELKQSFHEVEPKIKELFPAYVTMETLESDLKDLQDQFNREIYVPVMTQKRLYDSLQSNIHLLSDKEDIERTLERFKLLHDKVESQGTELSELVDSVSCWWAECEMVRGRVSEMTQDLSDAYPLAGTIPVIQKQDETIQDMLLRVEEMKPKVLRTVKHLTSLSKHEGLIVGRNIVECCDEFQQQWKELFEQVETRRDLTEVGRIRLSVYVDNRDPFDAWLEQAEAKLDQWRRVDTVGKEKLIELTEMLKVFKMDVDMHRHEIDSCESMANKFVEAAKKHQSILLSYKLKLHPEHSSSRILPDHFCDWESEGFISPSTTPIKGEGPVFHRNTYHNGLQVISDDLYNEKRRYEKLKGRVTRRAQRYEEAREKRLAFEEALIALVPKLEENESLVDELKNGGLGKGSAKSLKEQLDMMEVLETEFSSLRSLMDPLHLSVAAWMVREPIDSEAEEEEEEEEDDECVKENDLAQQRYQVVEKALRDLREELESSLAEAQVFQSAYSSFASWLRDTERKIQRDESLKLESSDLKSGLAYLKAVSGDISSHYEPYEELCKRFHTAIEVMKKGEDIELREKLDNLESRWNGLQVIHEDIEVIQNTLPLLDSFYMLYNEVMIGADELLIKLTHFSPSAITSDATEKKKEEFELILTQFKKCQSQFDSLLSDHDELFQTPFDQNKFQQSISNLKEKLNECKIVRDDKNRALKHIMTRVKSLEMNWAEFEAWLISSEEKVTNLNQSLKMGGVNLSEQLKQAQHIQEDITDHETSMEAIESLVSSLATYLEPHHMEKLETSFNNLLSRYRSLSFFIQAYPIEVWFHSRIIDLTSMEPCGVLVRHLQYQIQEIKRFQNQLDTYKSHLSELEEIVSSLPDQSESSPPKVKMAEMIGQYSKLIKLASQRLEVFNLSLPRVKLYENSLDNWEMVLTGWEESAIKLPPPTTAPIIIQSTIETIKALQIEISDQEPEFHSLLREAKQMYVGSEDERQLMDEIKSMGSSGAVSSTDVVRPGQLELQNRLDSNHECLDSLKRRLSDLYSMLTTLHDRVISFTNLNGQLLPWLQEQSVNDLEIVEPVYQVLQDQLDKCQSLNGHLKNKLSQKEELSKIFNDITSCMSHDNTEIIVLKNQIDQIQDLWLNLSDQISSALSSLEPATKLAKTYENGRDKLMSWLKIALGELTGLGPIPSEPEAVQELKIRIDDLKSEYNGLAPLLAKCTEDGLELAKYCQNPSKQGLLKSNINHLQNDWDSVGNMLSDLHQKLNDALMQTQEFQQVADSLDRWVNATQSSLKRLEPVAARVRLIEPQIEGFKPIIEDIKVNQTLLEQAKVIGQQLLVEATTEERLKVGKKLHSLEMRFYGLDKATYARMKELEDGLRKATVYEKNSSELSDWLKDKEEQLVVMVATPIRSQPLKTLDEEFKEFNQSVLFQEPVVTTMSTSETSLFQTDLQTILKYETQEKIIDFLSSPQHSRGPSPMFLPPNPETHVDSKPSQDLLSVAASTENILHPEFLDRPGAIEALEIGAKLRNRYLKLKSKSSRKYDETSQLLQTVLSYESNYTTFSDWLKEMVAKIQDLEALPISCEELEAQLQDVMSLQHDIENKEQVLESLNSIGTFLIDGCRDDLSKDSVSESLSDLNDQWGNLLSRLDERTKELNEGISLAKKYERLEKELVSWLNDCEARLDKPVLLTGSATEMEQLMKKLEGLRSEVSSRRSLMETLVSTGQNYESFVAESGDMTTPKLLLGYTDCQRRYENLLVKLDDKRKSTVDIAEKASELKLQLSNLLDNLLSLKTQLDNHEPPHLLPDPISEQLQHLDIINSQYNSLQISVDELFEEIPSFNLEEGSELQLLTHNVSSTNDDVKSIISQWQSRLQRARESALKFDRDYKTFSQWVSDVLRKLSSDDGIRATVEGVERQISDTTSLQDEISNHQQSLQKLMDLGRGMMGGASPEDCILIGDRLAQIQANYEIIQRQLLGRMQALKEGLKKAKEFSTEHETVLNKLEEQNSDLHMMPTVGIDIETVKLQLEDYKEFELEITELKKRITQCQLKGKQLKDSCHYDDHTWVDARLDELNMAWSKLQSSSLSRQQQLEDALLRLGQFHEALVELMRWMKECSETLLERKEPGVNIQDIEQQMSDLQVLQSEIVSHESTVSSLNEAGRKLVSGSHDDTTAAEIQKEVDEMNNEWHSLKSLTSDKQVTLSTALERARVFHADLKDLVEKFNRAEELATIEWNPHCLPATCQKDVDEHAEYMIIVQGLKEPMNIIKSEGEGLKSQGNLEDQEIVDRWATDLKDRWDELMATAEEKQSQLEEAKTYADEFDTSFTNLSDQLDQLKKQAEHSSSIHSEAEMVKKQLEDHKLILKQLKQLESQIEQLEGVGGAMMKNCVTEDGTVIKQKLTQLRSKYDELQTNALSLLSDLEEALLTVGQFEEAYHELRMWLGSAWDQLQNPEPIPGQSQIVATIAAKHKALQKELAARSTGYSSVMKAGKELMKTKQGDDKNVLKSKLADLEQEWEGVCQMSVARQQKLDNALKKLYQLESYIQPIKGWMTKVLPILDESEPVDGDVATVHELIESHDVFQNELGSYQKSIDIITSLGEELTEILDSSSPVKNELEELNMLWDDICNHSVSKQERLQYAMKAALNFNQGIRETWSWMEQKEAELDMMGPPAEDVAILYQQIEEHKILEQDVHSYQPIYEQVLDLGQSLHQLSHPRAEPVVFGQLQQLEQKWKGIKGKMSTRSEALATSLLEVHGLQDMMDELGDWVTGAEGDMAIAEGTPIGDDLESVEQQLNQHESFQEDMATHQPKMEALNKAVKRRKSRVSLTPSSSSNPEMNKRVSNLDKRWKRLWLRSNERHRQLLEARTRLKDIAMARSFNFDAWCKRFVSWVDQQKLRVNDLFRRFDTNHDGFLTREEFMKGLKASGLAMNQIELEKIADSFDRNKNGLIDLAEISAILKGQKIRRKYKTTATAKPLSDAEKINMEIHQQVSQCMCEHKYQVVPMKEGQYKFGESQKIRMVRILRSTVMVRVGGGWEPLEVFLGKNDPCRVTGRTNTEIFSDQTGLGVTQAAFKRKSQTAISAKNDAIRKGTEKDPGTKKITRTLPSGRIETLTTKKTVGPSVKVIETFGDSPEHQRTHKGGGGRLTKTPIRVETPTRKSSSLSRIMTPTTEHTRTCTHPHIPPRSKTPIIRSKTPSRHSLTREKSPPTQLNPERIPPRAKTPTRNGSLSGTRQSSDITPIRGPTPSGGTPTRTKGSKIPTPSSGSKIPTVSSRTRQPGHQ